MSDTETQDGNEAADSSDVAIQDGNAGESSTPEATDGKPVSAYDAVKAAMEADQEDSSTSDEQGSQDAGGKPEEADPTDEELEQFGKGAKTRIKSLIGERNDLRGEVEKLKAETGNLKARAERLDRVESFMAKRKLSEKEVDQGLAIMGEIKSGDPRKALQAIDQVRNALLKMSGAELPPDIQDRLDKGYLDELSAKELSAIRAEKARADARARQESAERQQRESAESFERQKRTAVEAAEAWASEQASRDPDWALKQDQVTDIVMAEVHSSRKFPGTAAEVRAIADKALGIVNERMKNFTPSRKRMTTVEPGRASTPATPDPTKAKSAFEAARMAIGR